MASDRITLLERLTRAYPKQIERIKECANTSLDVLHTGSAGDALSMVFVWGSTDEGHDYWADLADAHS